MNWITTQLSVKKQFNDRIKMIASKFGLRLDELSFDLASTYKMKWRVYYNFSFIDFMRMGISFGK